VIGLLVGLTFKLIGFAVAALLVVAGVSWVMRKLGRPTDIDRERLPRWSIELRQPEPIAGDPPCPLSFFTCSAS
jgi:hypothetical protein